ncbi:DUF4398 domain-containing protein [Methylobacter sp.]|uniref:DUF4398 domain-containing protein n=1 Tax=Methylobacter sp. TaxID=2051955 RepID=UPI0025DB0E3D|nr:DUF4398 domain-containing protein [Methylobacter sp.]
MKNHRYHLIILFAVAIVSGCTTMPKNASLTEAHNSFNNARTNPDVTNLAALELKAADDALKKADAALEDEDDETVNQLAYLAKQQVAVAEETAKQKAAELAIAYSTAKRTQIQLHVRTAEADAAPNSNSRSHMLSKPNEE